MLCSLWHCGGVVGLQGLYGNKLVLSKGNLCSPPDQLSHKYLMSTSPKLFSMNVTLKSRALDRATRTHSMSFCVHRTCGLITVFCSLCRISASFIISVCGQWTRLTSVSLIHYLWSSPMSSGTIRRPKQRSPSKPTAPSDIHRNYPSVIITISLCFRRITLSFRSHKGTFRPMMAINVETAAR